MPTSPSLHWDAMLTRSCSYVLVSLQGKPWCNSVAHSYPKGLSHKAPLFLFLPQNTHKRTSQYRTIKIHMSIVARITKLTCNKCLSFPNILTLKILVELRKARPGNSFRIYQLSECRLSGPLSVLVVSYKAESKSNLTST